MIKKPCLAITLIAPQAPQYASSYLWCREDEHETLMHVCYSGVWWLTNDLIEPTPEMVIWRTGDESDLKRVRGRMLG
jgi:hypothetical protein